MANPATRLAEDLQNVYDAESVYIPVMGMTGAGKSTFISQCVNHSQPSIGHSLESHTFATTIHTVQIKNKTVHLIDTPGFDDSRRSDAGTLQEISFWLLEATKRNIRLGGVIYLQPINTPRIQGSALRGLQIFKAICGRSSLEACMLVTTHWDSVLANAVSERQAHQRLQELLETDYLWGDMTDAGAEAVALSLNGQKVKRVVERLVDREHSVVLQLQREISNLHGRLCDTTAGQLVYQNITQENEGLKVELTSTLEDRETAQQEVHNQDKRRCQNITASLLKDVDKHNEELAQLTQQLRTVFEETKRQINLDREQLLEMLLATQQQAREDHKELRELLRRYSEQPSSSNNDCDCIRTKSVRFESQPPSTVYIPCTASRMHPSYAFVRVPRRSVQEQRSDDRQDSSSSTKIADRLRTGASVAGVLFGAATFAATACVVM